MGQIIEDDDISSWTNQQLFDYLWAISKVEPMESVADYTHMELLKLVKEDMEQ